GNLRAFARPVVDATQGESQRARATGAWIEKAHLLERAATLALALVSHHDVIEGLVFAPTAGQSDRHHSGVSVRPEKTRRGFYSNCGPKAKLFCESIAWERMARARRRPQPPRNRGIRPPL